MVLIVMLIVVIVSLISPSWSIVIVVVVRSHFWRLLRMNNEWLRLRR